MRGDSGALASTAGAARKPAGAAAAVPELLLAPWWAPGARVCVLVVTDLAALGAAAAAAWYAWASSVLGQPVDPYLELLPLLCLFAVGYASAGLYPGFGLGAIETLRRLTLRSTFLFVVLAAAAFALKATPRYSRVIFLLTWAASLAAVPLARYLVLSRLSRTAWWREPTVVVGGGARAQRVVRLLHAAVSLGYKPVVVLSPAPDREESSVDGVPVARGVELAPAFAAQGVRVVLVAGVDGPAWAATGTDLQRYYRHVVLLRDTDDLPVESVAIRNLGGVLGIEFANNLLRRGNRIVKRCLDLALGSVALVAALPIVALAALAIKLSDRGFIFFAQGRIGRGGRPITVWKLRTMRIDAEDRLRAHLETSPEARREWEERFKLARDPRIIPVVGAFLRRFSIDELPQLWSVLKGDMSLVGPRPFPSYHLACFPEDFRELRQSVRPGISGLWQVMVRNDGGVEDQRLYDTYYIRNWSIWMDLYLLGRTGVAVLGGRGAY
ncbi:MAG: exopolysaccharide biosynthesis polyprenyl glycosylphosphotransferase [Acidobacteriota bacterium]